MASLMSIANRLLPFATPGTPLLQDLIHLAVIATILYFAPQIQDTIQKRRKLQQQTSATEPEAFHNAAVHEREVEDLPQEDHEGRQDQEDFAEEVLHNANIGGPGLEELREFNRERDAVDDAEGAPGPANQNMAGAPRDIPTAAATRDVGAKKAKSLARKDQRRAYHEFQRAQGEAQRAKDAEGAAEREAAQAAERERRKAAEAKLEARKAKEREEKRQRELKAQEEERRRRELAIEMVKDELEERRMCNLIEVAERVGGEADEVWVEKILKAAGVLERNLKNGTVTMVTSTGWVVRVTKDDMARTYRQAVESGLGSSQQDGKIGFEEIGSVLEDVLKAY